MYGGSGPLGTVAATETDRAAVAQAILRGQGQQRHSRQSTATAMTSSSFDILPANALAWPSSAGDRNLLHSNSGRVRENSSRSSAIDVAASAVPLLAPAGTVSAASHDASNAPGSSRLAASVQMLVKSSSGVALAEHAAAPTGLAQRDPVGATTVSAPPVAAPQTFAKGATEQRDLQPLLAEQGRQEGGTTGATAAPPVILAAAAAISEPTEAATQASQSIAPALLPPNATTLAEASLLSEHSKQPGSGATVPSVNEPPKPVVKTEPALDASTVALNTTQQMPPLTQIRVPEHAARSVETVDGESGAELVVLSTPLQPEPSDTQLATLPRPAPADPVALPAATPTTIPATPTLSPTTPVLSAGSASAAPLATTSGKRVFRGVIVWSILGTLEVEPMNVWVAAARMCCSAALIQAALVLLSICVGFSWPVAAIVGCFSPAVCLLLAWLEEAWREEEAWLEETPRRQRAQTTREDPIGTTPATSSLGAMGGGSNHAQHLTGGGHGDSRRAGAVTATTGRGSRSYRDDPQGSSANVVGAGDVRRRIPASRSQPSIPAGTTVTSLSDPAPPAPQPRQASMRRPALARHTSMLGAFYDDDFDALVSRS